MELKEKFEIEFPIHASPHMLYQYISSASGLCEWFADDVNSRGKSFSFIWDGSEQDAKLLTISNNYFIKFRWLDYPENTFFEFRIEVDEITNDVILKVTDFAEDDEVEESKDLWTSQINTLMKNLGS